MDLQLYRVFIGSSSYYVSDALNHQRLCRILIRGVMNNNQTIYKLRNNYHLGIL